MNNINTLVSEDRISDIIKSAGIKSNIKDYKEMLSNTWNTNKDSGVGALRNALSTYNDAWSNKPVPTAILTAAGAIGVGKTIGAIKDANENKKLANECESDEIQKIAADMIIAAEDSYGRQLSEIEKVALLGAAGSFIKSMAPKVMSGASKVLSPDVMNKAQTWGKAISTSWGRGTSQGLGAAAKVSNAFRASAGANPLGTAAVTAGAGLAVGTALTNKKQNNAYMAPMMMPKVASFEDEEKRRKREKALMILGGLTIGGALAVRNKLKINNVKNLQYLDETTNLRNLGSTLSDKFKNFSAAKDQEFNSMFEGISDLKKRNIVKSTVKDIDKLVKETGDAMPKSEFRNTASINKELNNLVNKAHDANEIPTEAKKYLSDKINNRFKVKDEVPQGVILPTTKRFINGISLGSTPGNPQELPHILSNNKNTTIDIEDILRGDVKNLKSKNITNPVDELFKKK